MTINEKLTVLLYSSTLENCLNPLDNVIFVRREFALSSDKGFMKLDIGNRVDDTEAVSESHATVKVISAVQKEVNFIQSVLFKNKTTKHITFPSVREFFIE
jgi:hypothetical protein